MSLSCSYSMSLSCYYSMSLSCYSYCCVLALLIDIDEDRTLVVFSAADGTWTQKRPRTPIQQKYFCCVTFYKNDLKHRRDKFAV